MCVQPDILCVCRLEILRRNTEMRGEGCGKYVSSARARSGEVPGVLRPAAGDSWPLGMCVWVRVSIDARGRVTCGY
jgi:hypothetical protein